MKVGKNLLLSESHLSRLSIPKVHWAAAFDRIPKGCKHRDTIRRYLDAIEAHILRPTGLLLFGQYSTGKSAIAALCLKAAASRGVIGYWISAGDLPRYQIGGDPFDEEMSCYTRARSAPVLVVDEYFMRAEMKWTEDAVDALVRHRIDAQLCTIITTNHSPEQISDARPALGAALREAVYPVKVSGHDFRKELGQVKI